MGTTINTFIATAAMTGAAFAATSNPAEEPGMLAWAFMGFCAVILVGQLIPAALLIFGAFKGLVLTPKEGKKDR